MSTNLCFANTDTPTPGDAWRQLSDEKRLELVGNTVRAKMPFLNDILVIDATKQDGQVIADFLEPVPANRRGTLLLGLEAMLKESIDPGLTIWLEPVGDRSSLRNLRGIEVKS